MVPVLSVSLSIVTVVERLPPCPKPLMVLVQAGPGVGAGEGAVVQPDSDSTTAVYGKDIAFKPILEGKVPSPEMAKPFEQAVSSVGRAAAKEANEGKK